MLTRWDPFMEMQHLQDRLSRMAGLGQGRDAAFSPPVDIYENDTAIAIRAELPGIQPDDVKIDVEGNVLSLRGERKLENEEKHEGYHRIERSYGSFSRSFVLPNSVDAEGVEATMNHGILTISLPKKPAKQARSINVKSIGGQAGQQGTPKTITAEAGGQQQQQQGSAGPAQPQSPTASAQQQGSTSPGTSAQAGTGAPAVGNGRKPQPTASR